MTHFETAPYLTSDSMKCCLRFSMLESVLANLAGRGTGVTRRPSALVRTEFSAGNVV